MQRYRERQLEPPGEEEEEDEEEEEQTQEDAGDQETAVTNEQDDANKSGQSGISLRLYSLALNLYPVRLWRQIWCWGDYEWRIIHDKFWPILR